MMSEGVKETQCTSCSHREVCMYKYGHRGYLISSYDRFREVEVKCKYYDIDRKLVKRGEINT